MKVFKRLFIFISIGLLYLVIKEFLILYQAARSLHPYAAYALILACLGFVLYFAIIPLLSIFRLPQRLSPTRNPDHIQSIIEDRMKHFQKNRMFYSHDFNFDQVSYDRKGYDQALAVLQPELKRLQKKYVTQVFYSTAIVQNGFLDALLILSLSVNLVKDMFVLYHGRVPNRVLWTIGRMVFQSMLIGGSEGVEYAADEIFSKMFSGGIKGIPFASKILGSLADGFVNAALVTRIALITQNYCEMIFIESDRALYPAYKTITATTRFLVSDLLDRVGEEVRALAKDKASKVVLATVNPVGYVMSKSLDRMAGTSEKLTPRQREWMRETSDIAHNPFGFLAKKIRRLFGKNTKEPEPF